MMLCSGQFLAWHCSTQHSILGAHPGMAIDKCIIAGKGCLVAQDLMDTLNSNIMELPKDVVAYMQTWGMHNWTTIDRVYSQTEYLFLA